MKIKTVYIYIFIIAIAIIGLIISSGDETTNNNTVNTEAEIPNDDIHQSLGQTGEQQPSSQNVITDIRQRMIDLEEYVKSNPKDTAKVREYADLLSAAHNPAKAVELYESILKIDPNRIDILSQLGRLHFIKKDFEAARKSIKKIIKIDPKNLEALYNLGVIAANEGKTEQAINYWQDIIDKYPDSETAKLAKNSLLKL